MPRIINPYAADDSIAASLSTLAQSFFANTPQTELVRQKARGLIRENEHLPLLADAIVAGNVADATRHGILAGQDPKFTGGYNQFRVVNQYGPASREATTATMAVPGANFGHTVAGEREAQANKMAIERHRTERLLDAERYKADTTPQTVLGEGGVPVIMRRSESFGQRPVVSRAEAEGAILTQDAPTLTLEQRAQAGGYAPRAPSALYSYRSPDGREGTTADGSRDLHTGASLPHGTKVIKLEGPSTEGLTGNTTIDREVVGTEIATRQAVAAVDRLIGEFSKPTSAQSIGYLGTASTLYNNLRAQAEATARFVQGETADQALTNPDTRAAIDNAMTAIFARPEFNVRVQQLGVNAAIIRSQIQDLAYTMAKAQDPSGRVSVDDVRRAAETIGASLMDPAAAIPVLQDLKDRMVTNQGIREEVIRSRYPRFSPNTQAPQAGAPNPSDPLGIR